MKLIIIVLEDNLKYYVSVRSGASLSEGGGHAVDDVAQDLLEPGEPVGDLPEPPVSQGALHAVARTCSEIFRYCG